MRSSGTLAAMAALVLAILGPAPGMGFSSRSRLRRRLAVGGRGGGWTSIRPRLFLGWRPQGSAERRVLDELPDVVDLLRAAVAGGASVPLALAAVDRHGRGPVSEALRGAHRSASRGAGRLADQLEDVAHQLGDHSRPLLRALAAAERDGTPLGPALELVGRDLRSLRRRRVEGAIRRLPVQLVFPLVACTLPACVLLTVVPLAGASLTHLTN